MNEWKELKIDNLPPDILTGDYELSFNGNISRCRFNNILNAKSLINDLFSGCEIKYRRKEPKEQTHEEIMNKWWMILDNVWQKVDTINNRTGETEYVFNGDCFDVGMNDYNRSIVNKEWFIGRESADIPPESE